MARARPGSDHADADYKHGGGNDLFPETHSAVLAQAAAGNWRPFLEQYLQPCWREVAIACRRRRLPLNDAADVFQELMVRLIRKSRFGAAMRHALRESGASGDFQGNLPARYLKGRDGHAPSARFRTYLKAAIRNLVTEAVRQRLRQPRYCESQEFSDLAQASTQEIDRHWMAERLALAAGELHRDCQAARTRGQRRLFDVLYRSIVDELPTAKIAEEFQVDRTTVAALLTQARERFVTLLKNATGIEDLDELRRSVAAVPDAMSQAMRSARAGGTGELIRA